MFFVARLKHSKLNHLGSSLAVMALAYLLVLTEVMLVKKCKTDGI